MSDTGAYPTPTAEPLGSRVVVDRPLGIADKSFYLIGVGASAGGLEAIRQLIAEIPSDFPHSLVIIQHISPDYKSMMVDILSRHTAMTVREVQDDMAVEPGHIYLIPPKSNVIIQGTLPEMALESGADRGLQEAGTIFDRGGAGLRFSLVEPTPRPQLNLPIDLFFKSLAEAVGPRSIGIILSGSGSDGSRGLRSIKDHDGLVICQTPATAEFDGMPRAALETEIVDLVLAPDAIVPEVLRYIELQARGIMDVDVLFAEDTSLFRQILHRVSDQAEIDFCHYKEPTLKRRIARRVALTNSGSLEGYLKLLEADSDEARMLHGEFLVAVTNFFRDRAAWQVLEDEVIQGLFEDGDPSEPVKVWSVGCSTGEEPFSIAMVLQAYRKANGIDRDFRVIATDVNPDVIAVCRDGFYPERAFEEIPEEYRKPEFIEVGLGSLRISEPIRAKVLFRAHNAVEDTPYIRTDLLICRNVLIYLSPEIQQKLLTLFSFSLRQNGVLFLGGAESVHRMSPAFAPISERHRLYRNLGRTQARAALVTNSIGGGRSVGSRMPRLSLPSMTTTDTNVIDLMRNVLDEIGTCVILINHSGNIIETFGTGQKTYLSQPADAFSSNLFDLLDPSLRGGVTLALRRLESRSSAAEARVRQVTADKTHEVEIHCREAEWHKHGAVYAVILRRVADIGALSQTGGTDPAANLGEETQAYVYKLEAELASTQDMLATSFEDLGTANEELQASNEELQAANEELQANNEEVQSVNEELHTVNAENIDRIAQLEGANTDIQNLLDDDQVGKILLDGAMRIRRFTTGINRYVDLKPHDLGRPLANFSSSIMPGFFGEVIKDAEHARDTGESKTREVPIGDDRWVFVRANPFLTNAGRRDGAVLTFIDITDVRELQSEVARQKKRLEIMLESEAAGYWDVDLVANTTFLSPKLLAMLGLEPSELGSTKGAVRRYVHPEDLAAFDAYREGIFQARHSKSSNIEVRFLHKDGKTLWMHCRGSVVEHSPEGRPLRAMGVHIDITDFKHREAETQQRAEEVRRFAFMASHDLLQPMNTIQNATNLLWQELDGTLSGNAETALALLSKSSDRMALRIRGVLEYASLQDGTVALEPVDLTLLCKSALDEAQEVADHVKANIHIGELGQAMGNPGLIIRVFSNLLANSLKYLRPDAAPRIQIDQIPGRSGFVTVAFRDNGIGIAAEDREKVFHLFARLHSDRDFAGNGLGLALCERILDRCGGRIWLDDGIDGGLSVIFELRVLDDDQT